MAASDYKKFDDFIKEEFFNKKGYFYREIYFLLSQDFREIQTYFSILQAVAYGNTKPNEIGNFIGKNTREIYPYMENLIRLGMVRREETVIGKTSGLYFLKECFIDLWFNFVHKYRGQIEMNESFTVNKRELDAYFGKRFEQLAKELIIKKKPFEFQKIGGWWHKDKEIDVVALNNETKEIAFFEVKWGDIEIKAARNILNELKEKSKFVKWNDEKRREYYGIIAREIEDKESLIKGGFLVFDLDDFAASGSA